jgi:hypothetical protein
MYHSRKLSRMLPRRAFFPAQRRKNVGSMLICVGNTFCVLIRSGSRTKFLTVSLGGIHGCAPMEGGIYSAGCSTSGGINSALHWRQSQKTVRNLIHTPVAPPSPRGGRGGACLPTGRLGFKAHHTLNSTSFVFTGFIHTNQHRAFILFPDSHECEKFLF